MMSLTSPMFASARPISRAPAIDARDIVQADVRQDQVLLIGDAHLVRSEKRSARSATTSIWSAEQSPGVSPGVFSEIVDEGVARLSCAA